MRRSGILGLALMFLVVLGSIGVQPGSASAFSGSTIHLPTPTIHQILNPTINGDNGTYNCTAASLAMVLQTIQPIGKGAEADYDRYLQVRDVLRSDPATSDPYTGIPFKMIRLHMGELTENAFIAKAALFGPDDWTGNIESQIGQGLPVIAMINDVGLIERNYNDVFGYPHAITITGIEPGYVTYNDPWDGSSHRMDSDAFGAAWSTAFTPSGMQSAGWVGVDITATEGAVSPALQTADVDATLEAYAPGLAPANSVADFRQPYRLPEAA